MAQILIDKDKCDGCGYCVSSCGQGVLALDVGGKAEVISPSTCVFCRDCVNSCPLQAVVID